MTYTSSTQATMIIFRNTDNAIVGWVPISTRDIESIAHSCAAEARHLAAMGCRRWTAHCPEIHALLFGYPGDGVIAKYEAGAADHGHWIPESPQHWLDLWEA
jgi:hypothetical protein